jgi:hypothetical protein
MITANNIAYLTAVPAEHLNAIALNSGYKRTNIRTAKFLGLTNGGQFCYATTFYDDLEGEEIEGKVFLTYDHDKDKVTLDF